MILKNKKDTNVNKTSTNIDGNKSTQEEEVNLKGHVRRKHNDEVKQIINQEELKI